MDIMQKIQDGYKKFRAHVYPQYQELYKELVEKGQSPKAMVITCADSRISTGRMMDTEPGDLFIVRNVANLVPSYKDGELHMSTTAALEFAVTVLQVEHIIIVGHSHCGGIAALMQGGTDLEKDNSIINWVKTFTDTRDIINDKYPELSFEEKCHRCELQALDQSLQNLREYPWIKQRCDNNKLSLHSWYFDVTDAVIYHVEHPSLKLTPLDEL